MPLNVQGSVDGGAAPPPHPAPPREPCRCIPLGSWTRWIQMPRPRWAQRNQLQGGPQAVPSQQQSATLPGLLQRNSQMHAHVTLQTAPERHMHARATHRDMRAAPTHARTPALALFRAACMQFLAPEKLRGVGGLHGLFVRSVLSVVGCVLLLHEAGCVVHVACRLRSIPCCRLRVACRRLHAAGCILSELPD